MKNKILTIILIVLAIGTAVSVPLTEQYKEKMFNIKPKDTYHDIIINLEEKETNSITLKNIDVEIEDNKTSNSYVSSILSKDIYDEKLKIYPKEKEYESDGFFYVPSADMLNLIYDPIVLNCDQNYLAMNIYEDYPGEKYEDINGITDEYGTEYGILKNKYTRIDSHSMPDGMGKMIPTATNRGIELGDKIYVIRKNQEAEIYEAVIIEPHMNEERYHKGFDKSVFGGTPSANVSWTSTGESIVGYAQSLEIDFLELLCCNDYYEHNGIDVDPDFDYTTDPGNYVVAFKKIS